MIQEVRIRTLEEVMPLLSDQPYRESIGRYRSSYVYRGMPDASFKMVTTLRRNCGEYQRVLEPSILQSFAKYAVMEDPSIQHSVWRQMIVGQHHGLPTRLLDWTHSALVSLHFSNTEEHLENMDRRDSVIWRIDMEEIHSLLPPRYQEVMRRFNHTDVFSTDMLDLAASSLEQYDRDMGDHAMIVLEPPSIDSRIVNQYSFFSVIPTGMDDIEGFLDRSTQNTVRYIIDRSLRWRIRDMLDQLNMSERIVYPDLDGLSQWIGRHYYVRNREEPK